nr:immunoglobulin heavy chain junction region [Macaca mulatta]MOW91085.1 immunoglobulin heavy chain junction region [Macaca mulatta]
CARRASGIYGLDSW